MAKRPAGKAPKHAAALSEMQCTCALIRRSARQITQTYDSALKGSGLRITQYSILANLARLRSASITELADVLVVDRTTLTRNLRPLQRDGLVWLSDGADNRSKTLSITSLGRDVLKTAQPLWRKAERLLRRDVGEDTVAQLRTLLERIAPSGHH